MCMEIDIESWLVRRKGWRWCRQDRETSMLRLTSVVSGQMSLAVISRLQTKHDVTKNSKMDNERKIIIII